MSRAIVVFADGTGNARTARFRTNVWKMYATLDLSPEANQTAFYIDGVGTSAFAPLRLLGGVFGVGVKRNVRDVYGFLCRNYQPGARIYIFGFSRGAFTARVLAGLIARIGVMHIEDDRARAEWVREAFRRYRQQVEYRSRAKLSRAIGWLAARVEDGLRALRRAIVRPRWSGVPDDDSKAVRMVGCWDTVSAYGGPITEMVRGWDQYVTPLSLPDYRLHPNIACARHALALDEEREAFLPLLWDECDPGAQGRIRQVWFAGVHSDVGGGYPDIGLSSIPLGWMIEEAQQAGLTFEPGAVAKIARVADPTAPIHDSRGGIGAFYRYQPRRLSVLSGNRPSPLRDPVSGKQPLIDTILVHPSVLQRVSGGCDGYAPIVLPGSFDVAGHRWSLDIDRQEAVWRRVTQRRWLQFALLATVFLALLAPLFPGMPIVDYIDQASAPVLAGLFGLVPGVPAWAAHAYGGSGVWMTAAAVLIAIVLSWTDNRRLAIAAAARRSWRFNPDASSTPPSAQARRLDFTGAVRQYWRWTAAPAAFGALYYSVVVTALFACADKLAVIAREHDNVLCATTMPDVDVIDVSQPCQRLAGPRLIAGQQYRLRIIIPEGGRWKDGGVDADPTGFSVVESVRQALDEKETWGKRIGKAAKRFAAHGLVIPARRVITARWFQPVLAIRPGSSDPRDQLDPSLPIRNVAVSMAPTADPRVFYGEITAPVTGQPYLFVNDATLPFGDPGTRHFYSELAGPNSGRACVGIQPSVSPFRQDDEDAARDCEERAATFRSADQQ